MIIDKETIESPKTRIFWFGTEGHEIITNQEGRNLYEFKDAFSDLGDFIASQTKDMDIILIEVPDRFTLMGSEDRPPLNRFIDWFYFIGQVGSFCFISSIPVIYFQSHEYFDEEKFESLVKGGMDEDEAGQECNVVELHQLNNNTIKKNELQ